MKSSNINGVARRSYTAGYLLGFLLLLLTAVPQVRAQEMDQEQTIAKLQKMTPARGYIDAHKNLQKPLGLLGGPIEVTITQTSGGVFVSLPDQRKLDPNVFGTPEMPRAFSGTPGVNGVPPMARGVEHSAYTVMKPLSPFGDKYTVMADGKLSLKAVDATATDAAKTEDAVDMMASWKDQDGNTYEVRCCQMLAAHGMEFPTFGGVVTNHILHGFTRIGTALMPSAYAYVAFWGMGEVKKNGVVLDKPRLVHGMLTEYVRKEGYKLAFDDEVTPTRQHFHLMVAPFVPVMDEGRFMKKPVKTGFNLPNGMELPFWHVMFENLEIDSKRSE